MHSSESRKVTWQDAYIRISIPRPGQDKTRQESCTQTPYERSYMAWDTNTLLDTAFDPHFETGRVNVLTTHVRFVKWRWHMTGAPRLKGRTLVRTFSIKGAYL